MPLWQPKPEPTPEGLDKYLNERVVVQPGDNAFDSLAGVLVGNYADCVELAAPTVVDGDRRDPVNGPLTVLKERIYYVQRDV